MSFGLGSKSEHNEAAHKSPYGGNEEEDPSAKRFAGWREEGFFAARAWRIIPGGDPERIMSGRLKHPHEGDCADPRDDADQSTKEQKSPQLLGEFKRRGQERFEEHSASFGNQMTDHAPA